MLKAFKKLIPKRVKRQLKAHFTAHVREEIQKI